MKARRSAAALAAAAMLMAAGLAGCYSEDKPSNSTDTAVSAEDKTGQNEQSAPSADVSTAEEKPDVSQTHQNDPMNAVSAWELVADMKIGWNLGNTLDATGGSGVDSEISWLPNPVKTDEFMIKSVKDQGFNVLRLPVSWGNHMSDDYTVDPEWMDRVQEVVNYGIDNGMYVILNTHHEEWYMPTEENLDHDLEEIEALWKQIAERFKGYDEHLIFEGLNEPRLRGTGQEWTGTNDARAIVNQYEKKFVETVRATGGNNADRCLMITGYAASSARENLAAIELPEDSDKLIISVHAYLPYSFALDTKGTDVYKSVDSSITDLFKNLDDLFLSKGLPVIVGEFGSVNKDNLEDRVQCAKDYLTTASSYGIPCVWWDNYARFGAGENFGLFDRAEYSWYFPDLMKAMMESVE